MKVCKFGGSSLANADQIRKACDIVLSDPRRRIMVVSAPGKRNREDSKVTDLLIALANSLLAGESGEREFHLILKRFSSIAHEMHLAHDIERELKEDLQNRILQYKEKPAHLLDALKAAGEDNCAKLVAAYLQAMGVEAHYVHPKEAGLLLTSEHGNGSLLPESYEQLAKLKERSGILVFPGFFGYSREGDIVTFSRGGSDITGSILAAAVGAELYENWSDVDSVYAVNPELVSHPAPIREMTYAEMRELAYAGFSVLHEETLQPVMEKGIPLCIRNTNNPSAPGTRIVSQRVDFDGIVTGIAGSKGFCSVQISKYLMNREVGFVYRLLGIFEELGLPVEHLPSGIDSLTVVLKESQFTEEKERQFRRLLKERLQLEPVRVDRGLAMIMIVGAAMAQTPGVMARSALALGRAGINIELCTQGVSEISILFGIRREYSQYAVKELYNEFFKGRELG